MKRSNPQTLLIASLGLVSILGLGAFRPAGGSADARQERIVKRVDRILEQIDATPEQASQIRAIRDKLLADRPKPEPRKDEMLEFWNEANPDAKEIHARIDRRFDERRAFAHEMADAMIQVHGILTPEQRAKVADLLSKQGHGKMGKRGKQHHAPAAE